MPCLPFNPCPGLMLRDLFHYLDRHSSYFDRRKRTNETQRELEATTPTISWRKLQHRWRGKRSYRRVE
ncbi:hypothetical protein ANTPLA_LOCUS6614 [Anthophora plagiata]